MKNVPQAKPFEIPKDDDEEDENGNIISQNIRHRLSKEPEFSPPLI